MAFPWAPFPLVSISFHPEGSLSTKSRWALPLWTLAVASSTHVALQVNDGVLSPLSSQGRLAPTLRGQHRRPIPGADRRLRLTGTEGLPGCSEWNSRAGSEDSSLSGRGTTSSRFSNRRAAGWERGPLTGQGFTCCAAHTGALTSLGLCLLPGEAAGTCRIVLEIRLLVNCTRSMTGHTPRPAIRSPISIMIRTERTDSYKELFFFFNLKCNLPVSH